MSVLAPLNVLWKDVLRYMKRTEANKKKNLFLLLGYAIYSLKFVVLSLKLSFGTLRWYDHLLYAIVTCAAVNYGPSAHMYYDSIAFPDDTLCWMGKIPTTRFIIFFSIFIILLLFRRYLYVGF
jgi:hypothetical protein